MLDVTAWSRSEPVEALAGERFSDAIAAISAATDSLELQLDELGAADVGSSFKDNLEINKRISNFYLHGIK